MPGRRLNFFSKPNFPIFRVSILGESRGENPLITAVTLSDRDLSSEWKIPDVLLFTYTKNFESKYSSHNSHNRDRARIEYLTRRRNEANSAALKAYPETKHILAIDSYYLGSTEEILALVREYQSLGQEECILGGSTWFVEKARIPSVIRFYDIWSTPEMDGFHVRQAQDLPSGLLKVSSVGAVYIYPRWVWEKFGYGIPEPFPNAGIFHNWLCQKSGLPVYLDCSTRFWRTKADNPDIPDYSLFKRIRCTLALGRFIPIRRRKYQASRSRSLERRRAESSSN